MVRQSTMVVALEEEKDEKEEVVVEAESTVTDMW
jgi:hypothetical protein